MFLVKDSNSSREEKIKQLIVEETTWSVIISVVHFELRHRLVHGVCSCGFSYAKERVIWAIDATVDVRKICLDHGINLESRLPVRRKIYQD